VETRTVGGVTEVITGVSEPGYTEVGYAKLENTGLEKQLPNKMETTGSRSGMEPQGQRQETTGERSGMESQGQKQDMKQSSTTTQHSDSPYSI